VGFLVSPAVMAMDSVPPSRPVGQWVERDGEKREPTCEGCCYEN
jgi:hypothetical protein